MLYSTLSCFIEVISYKKFNNKKNGRDKTKRLRRKATKIIVKDNKK
jgi:hypothetical protein